MSIEYRIENGREVAYTKTKWRCVGCGPKTEARLYKDLVAPPSKDGIRRGICRECGEKIIESDPQAKRERASIDARLAVQRGTPQILKDVRRFTETPGWWKNSPNYPKSR